MSVAAKASQYPWRRALLALALIAVAGAVRMPLEQSMEEELRGRGFREWSPDISAREQMTQAGFVGALGGFRSLVASVYDLKSHIARTDKDWGKVESYRKVTTSLQPRFWKHWDMAAWDMFGRWWLIGLGAGMDAATSEYGVRIHNQVVGLAVQFGFPVAAGFVIVSAIVMSCCCAALPRPT